MTARKERECGDGGVYTCCWICENLLLHGSTGGYKWKKRVNLNWRWYIKSGTGQGEFEGVNVLTGLREPWEVRSQVYRCVRLRSRPHISWAWLWL